MARKRLGEILIEAGALDHDKLQRGLIEQRRWGGQLGRILIEHQLVTEAALVAALSTQLRIPTVDLVNVTIPEGVLRLIPVELARQHGVVPVRLDKRTLDVAMSDPTNLAVIDEIQIRSQLDVNAFIAGPRQIEDAISRWYFGTHEPRPGESVELVDNKSRVAARGATRRTAPAMPAIGGAAASLPGAAGGAAPADLRDREIASLQKRIQTLEGLLERDEDLLRQLCLLLIEKQHITRDELMLRLGR